MLEDHGIAGIIAVPCTTLFFPGLVNRLILQVSGLRVLGLRGFRLGGFGVLGGRGFGFQAARSSRMYRCAKFVNDKTQKSLLWWVRLISHAPTCCCCVNRIAFCFFCLEGVRLSLRQALR